MPELIILKLIPTSPVIAATFTRALQGLRIRVFDLTVDSSIGGVEIGSTTGIPVPLHPLGILDGIIPRLESSIIQDFELSAPGDAILKSVATAVIVVDPPTGHLDHRGTNAFHLRIELERAGLILLDTKIEYHVTTQLMVALSPIQADYLALPASVIIPIPAGNLGLEDNSIAFVPLKPNGLPPDFKRLVKAINLVLSLNHPASDYELHRLEVRNIPLTSAQCHQIAAEIVWNRTLYPPPLSHLPLSDLYTIPDNGPHDLADTEQVRLKFEGQLYGYRATHDAEALRLASYVYSASSAISCERLSVLATTAELRFPIDIALTPSPTTYKKTSVLLTGVPDANGQLAPLNPSIYVPAEYFYVLGVTLPMQMAVEERYQAALLLPALQLRTIFGSALSSGFLDSQISPTTIPAPPLISEQAARRLEVLSSKGISLPRVVLAPPISVIMDNSSGVGSGWLNYAGTNSDGDVDIVFWIRDGGMIVQQPLAYLNLVLLAITEGNTILVAAIINILGLRTVADLGQITDSTWMRFFIDNPDLLPAFTLPGSPTQRGISWIQRLNKFFQVPIQLVTAPPPMSPVNGPDVPTSDALQLFIAEYNQLHPAGFDFSAPLDQTALEVALHVIFPQSEKARRWLKQALDIIFALYQVTSIGQTQLQFSLMEALYARGYTSTSLINELAVDDFQSAMTGTVAYPYARAIHALSLSLGPPPKIGGAGPALGFIPVNSDRTLTDCIPPQHLSPLGYVQYLHEMLLIPVDGTTLGDYIARRRGPLGELHATAANLNIPIPCIDLVIESLETLGGAPASGCGAIYDTNPNSLAGYDIGPGGHDAVVMYKTIPEHSSPAIPVDRPAIYDTLKTCFTAPTLPYSQPLDICRTYLRRIGTNRYQTMLHFREDITELAMDASHEPADFQRNLWRFPVRLDIALEYLHITIEEYSSLYSGNLPQGFTLELYGLPSTADNWRQILFLVPEFMKRTGLSYCEFLGLWRCQYVPFGRDEVNQDNILNLFPECEPTCLEHLRLAFISAVDPIILFRKLAVFIRLWRRLQALLGPKITFQQLADICNVLSMFNNDIVNPEFIRQLIALIMLRDEFNVPVSKFPQRQFDPSHSPETRTQILALWVHPVVSAKDWEWAVNVLLDHIDDYAKARFHCSSRGHSFRNELTNTILQLSHLAGFTTSDPWYAKPTSTLRFAEILAKIYASKFTVGEIIFLFTTNRHLHGDDPFPLPSPEESAVEPLNYPDDCGDDLWKLRAKLLSVNVDDDELEKWNWKRIREGFHELGYHPKKKSLKKLAERFFPYILKTDGKKVKKEDRRFKVGLPEEDTTPRMWHAPHHGPFHYDEEEEELWIELPLSDEAVIDKLRDIRHLNDVEASAVQKLYFAPRAALAPFAPIFANFNHAVEKIIQEPSEKIRFSMFRKEFVNFYRRCEVIAQHLADHVAAVTDGENDEGHAVAWEILRQLLADENKPTVPEQWEHDSGEPPERFTWKPHISGGAFAALNGLIGTGLLAEFRTKGRTIWRDVSGDLNLFGGECRNEHNAPVPTILPSFQLDLTPSQQHFVSLRNGFALRDINGQYLGGAQPFTFCWSGALLIETDGEYTFYVGFPAPEFEKPDFGKANHNRWLITLRYGQQFWTVVNNKWHADDAPDHASAPLQLKKGAYHIEIHFDQREPLFKEEACIRPLQTGFQVKYTGPDTNLNLVTIPKDKLFREWKKEPLGNELDVTSTAAKYLNRHFTSSLRDIRRTYQRAFKAVLLGHRFRLSGKRFHCDHSSELSLMLNHPGNFLGSSYHRHTTTAPFRTHHAYFDLNFLPVTDAYHPPPSNTDSRVNPSMKRKSALFAWWERIFDYCDLRHDIEKVRKQQPVWFMFHEALMQVPPTPDQLIRYLNIDINYAPLVLQYFANHIISITSLNLGDERWTCRVWRGGLWIGQLKRKFHTRVLEQARPAHWAADDPGVTIGPISGNQNLTRFVSDTCFATMEPRSYKEVRLVNAHLRTGAREALFAYLCGMDRVPLNPFRGFHRYAKSPHDLTDLLLQDVEVGFCESATRIEDGMTSVHNLVQRARLGLELDWIPTEEFVEDWDANYATFEIWEARKRREVYRENWIGWDEMHKARRSEAFQLLESELRRSTLSAPKEGGLVWWSSKPSPDSLKAIQSREFASLNLTSQLPSQGLPLLGVPEHGARLSLLGPFNDSENRPSAPMNTGTYTTTSSTIAPFSAYPFPLWVRSAIKMGVRFVRVAAATIPPSITSSLKTKDCTDCCAKCGERHAPEIDEFYFWLADTRRFDDHDAPQDADFGWIPPDSTTDWDRLNKLPSLLHWSPQRMIHLFWTRVHYGRWDPPRRSNEGLPVDASVPVSPLPQLTFIGRTADSLTFNVTALPSGSGFMYDLTMDSAIVLPQLIPKPNINIVVFPRPLPAYPYFVYFNPGAPLIPPSAFAISLAIAGSLRSHCCFDLALKWYELTFNPLEMDNTWTQCQTHSSTGMLRPRSAPSVTEQQGCYYTPESPGVLHGRAVLLDYLEVLLQWGDALMCKNSRQATRQAIVVFDLIEKILGPRPKRIHIHDTSTPMTIKDFKALAAPLNPRLMELYERAEDRRALIHVCDSSRCQCNNPNNFGQSCDGCQSTMQLCHGRHPYRFSYMLPKALELAKTVQSLGTSLLSAFEKGDAEYLAGLRATHDRQLLHLTLDIQKNTWRESDWQVQALQKTLLGAQTRLRYFQALISHGLNAGEVGYQSATNLSISSNNSGNVEESVAHNLTFTPDLWFGVAGALGTPLDFQQVPIGNKLAAGYSKSARILNVLGEIASTQASVDLKEGAWERREDYWRHEVDLITIEIQQITREIHAAERRRDISFRSLNNHQRKIEHSIEVQDFMRDKFTSHDLYLFLQSETSAIYQQTYSLALHATQEAQQLFHFERGDTLRSYLPAEMWNDMREGLLAGERLELALRTMQRAYLESNCRQYELTKHISLLTHFPTAFLHLKTTGSCEIDIPEWFFDLDYPGHYMRRIQSVSLTIPCTLPPYVGPHCRLQLLHSTIRVETTLRTPTNKCCPPLLPQYEPDLKDPRFRHIYGATESIATSSGKDDSGLFHLKFDDDRFLPFEYSGVVSRWRIELPPENNQFDLESLTDLVMHVKYTAREGGEELRKAANESAQRYLPANGLRLFDIKHDFPFSWGAIEGPSEGERDLMLRFKRDMFPFLTGNREIRITDLDLFIETVDRGQVRQHIPVKYFTQDHIFTDPPEDCSCETMKHIDCSVTSDWPHLFHGTLHCKWGKIQEDGQPKYKLASIGGDSPQDLGRLRFPRDTKIKGMWMLCRYEVVVPLKKVVCHDRHHLGWGREQQHRFHSDEWDDYRGFNYEKMDQRDYKYPWDRSSHH